MFWTPSSPSTWYSEGSVTKLPTAPWTLIALGCKFGVQASSYQEGSGAPRPRRQPAVGEVYIWIFTHLVAAAQTLTNLEGAGFSELQPSQILALPPAPALSLPAAEVLPSPRGRAIPRAPWSPGPVALAEQLWLRL